MGDGLWQWVLERKCACCGEGYGVVNVRAVVGVTKVYLDDRVDTGVQECVVSGCSNG